MPKMVSIKETDAGFVAELSDGRIIHRKTMAELMGELQKFMDPPRVQSGAKEPDQTFNETAGGTDGNSAGPNPSKVGR